MMKMLKDRKGVSLVELIITLAVFSVIMTMIYSVYTSFIKFAVTETKTTKTELDMINTVWPMMKEIQSAGMGTPSDTDEACFSSISVAGGVLTIHSTASGDDPNAGRWSYIADDCSISDFAVNEKVVIINALDKKRIDTATISAGPIVGSSPCNSAYADNMAYWYETGGGLECYETRFSLRAYDADTRPNMCDANTSQLSRSVSLTAGTVNYQPVLDCVFGADGDGDTGLNYRFGCVESDGNITWQTGTNCGSGDLLFVRISILVQNSSWKQLESPATITLFEDMPAAQQVTIDLTARNYKWKKAERTIVLRNIDL